jgi:hypothetical protein
VCVCASNRQDAITHRGSVISSKEGILSYNAAAALKVIHVVINVTTYNVT